MNDYKERLAAAATHIEVAQEVFRVKAEALAQTGRRLDSTFESAVELLLDTKGRVVLCGVGKSGLVGRKISATLASTGTPSFFLHPTEAFHGDLGMLKELDTVLLISYSGETEEVLKLLPALKRLNVRTVALTGNPHSTLASQASLHLDVSVAHEVCPHNLAPTTSTTVTIAMGDALAVALVRARDFQPEDFALRHPGGSLGKALSSVTALMSTTTRLLTRPEARLQDLVHCMSDGRLGLAVVVDEEHRVLGLVTDGDLRRAMGRHLGTGTLRELTAGQVMTQNPHCVGLDILRGQAKQMMEELRVKALVVTDDSRKFLGVLDWHSLA